MKKLFKVMFVAILAIAVAAPAMAEIKVNGYMRTIMQADNVDGFVNGVAAGPGAKDAETASEVDQRFRAKITNQLTDEVKWVYYGEVDTPWGDRTDGGAITGGGGLGADGVNLQTKNAYFSFNVPNTMFSFALGTQGFSPGFDGIILAHDASGLKANVAMSDTMDLGIQYAKFEENTIAGSDDYDYYAVLLKNKLGNGAKLNLAAIRFDDNSDGGLLKDDNNYIGAEYMGKVGGIGLNGWLLYEFGTNNDGAPTEQDLKAYAATVQAVMGKAAVRFTYATGQDLTDTTDDEAFRVDIGGGYFFVNENLTIFPFDKYYMNLGSTGVAKQGNGIMAINAKYDTMVGDYYLKLGAGYFMSAEDDANGEDELGTEVCARIGKKVAEKVDVSLIGSYVAVGDGLALNGDDIFKAQLMVNLPF